MLLITRYWLGLLVTGYFLGLGLSLWLGLGFMVRIRVSVLV